MITREADYTIRTILYLSQQGECASVATPELAEKMCVPYRFLRKILKGMVDAGLVVSQRGKGGGVQLSRPMESISLLDVLRATDPKGITLNVCLGEEGECVRSGICSVHRQMDRLQRLLDRELAAITFDKLVH